MTAYSIVRSSLKMIMLSFKMTSCLPLPGTLCCRRLRLGLKSVDPCMFRVLGLIRRTFGSKDSEAIKTSFNVLVRPILEYGTHI